MKQLLFIAFLIIGASQLNALLDRVALVSFFKRHAPKEDILMDGAVVIKGTQRIMAMQRYALIKKVVDQYKRPVMIADLDPQWGYCSFCLAREYPAVCVMVDDYLRTNKPCKKIDLLTALCIQNERLSGLVLLEAKKDRKHLKELSACEHFDVVLASNLLCAAGKQWRELAEVILNVGETILIDIPVLGSARNQFNAVVQCSTYEIKNFIESKGGSLVGSFGKSSEWQMYVLYCKKTSIKNCCLNDSHWHPEHQIKSDFYKKIFYKGAAERQWYPGINIMTFHALNGHYPSQDLIFKKFEEIAPFTPKGANVLIQGKSLLVLPT